jgi:hypothetical protein
MTIPDPQPPRLRLRFIVSLLLVLPFLAHAIWDFVEARRLNARIDAIVASGAPTTNEPYRVLSGGAADADRYYRAAAALVGPYRVPAAPDNAHRVDAALRNGGWTPDLVDEVRAQIDEQREALSLADRGAALPFEGFAPGWSSTYLSSGIGRLARLCDLRAVERALAGDSDAAFDSLYSEVQLSRTTGQKPQIVGLSTIVARAKSSAAARARLDQRLAELDRPDQLAQDFTRLRAGALDESRHVALMPWISRPLMVRQVTRRLDTFAALIAAAQKPAAERHAAVMAVGEWPTILRLPEGLRRGQLEMRLRAMEREIAAIHCARRLIAGEVVNCQP